MMNGLGLGRGGSVVIVVAALMGLLQGCDAEEQPFEEEARVAAPGATDDDGGRCFTAEDGGDTIEIDMDGGTYVNSGGDTGSVSNCNTTIRMGGGRQTNCDWASDDGMRSGVVTINEPTITGGHSYTENGEGPFLFDSVKKGCSEEDAAPLLVE